MPSKEVTKTKLPTEHRLFAVPGILFTKWPLWLLSIAAFFLLSVWYEIGFATEIGYLKYNHFSWDFVQNSPNRFSNVFTGL